MINLKHNTPFLIFCMIIFLQGCITSKQKNITKEKYLRIRQVLELSIQQINLQLDSRINAFGKYAEENNNDNKSSDKLKLNAMLGKGTKDITGDIDKIKVKLSSDFTVKQFINPKNEYLSINWLTNELNKHTTFLRQHLTSYLLDSTYISSRYLPLLPLELRKKIPAFSKLYFKGASQEEALVVLSTLQLGILQEALEIQEKILKE